RERIAMERIVTLLVALGIASAPAFVAGASVAVQGMTTTATAGAAGTTTNTTKTGAQTTTTAAKKNATTSTTTVAAATTGNGAPSGTHYNLNIIGVPKDKTASLTGNDGHRIFVELMGGDSVSQISGKNFNDPK